METLFSLLKGLLGKKFFPTLLSYLVKQKDMQKFILDLLLKPASKLELTNPTLYLLLKQYLERVVSIPAIFADENLDNATQVIELFKLQEELTNIETSGKALVNEVTSSNKRLKLKPKVKV